MLGAAILLGLAVGLAVGTQGGDRTLGRGFAGLVVAVAACLLVSATVLGGPPGS